MRKNIIVLMLILSVSLAASDRQIDVNQCIQIALQYHPDIMVSLEDKKIALYHYRLVNSQNSLLVNGEIKTVEYLKPTASSSSNFNIPGKDTAVGLFAGMTAVYNLYDSKRGSLDESSRFAIDLSKLQHEKTKNDLVYNVKKNYFEYLMSKENFSIAAQMLVKHRQKLQLANVIFKSGQRPILDVSKAEVGVAQAELENEKSKNLERISKLQLYKAMGIIDSNVNLVPRNIEKLPLLRFSSEELMKLSEVYYPEIQIIKTQKNISRIKISIEESASKPKVDLVLALGYENKNLQEFSSFQDNLYAESWNPTFRGALRAYFPIYTGGAISAKVDTAVSEYNKMVYKEREIMENIKIIITNSVKGLEELLIHIGMSEKILQNSRQHLVLAQKSYENGAGTLLELQDAELNFIQSQKGLSNSKYQYLLTMANLARFVGISEELICKNGD